MFVSVCASAVFMGMPLEDTMEAMHRCGARHYEFWSWWDQDIEAVKAAQERWGMKPMLMCTRFVPLTLPQARAEYLDGLAGTLACCRRLGCGTIITQVGALQPFERGAQRDSVVEGLRQAGRLLEGSGVDLVFEPLNTKIDHPGYFLTDAEEAFGIQEAVGMDNVKVLFDLYHQYITEGIDVERIERKIRRIGHFHLAGYPGRHEPFVPNEIPYETLLAAIRRAGYDRGFGLEYFPESAEQREAALSAALMRLRRE